MVRLTHYLTPPLLAICLLLCTDVGLATGRGSWFDRALFLHLFILEVLCIPIQWGKVRGGVQLDWISYRLSLGRFELGVSEGRAAWAVRWWTDKARERRVPLGELREGLGRLQFVAGPLDHLRYVLPAVAFPGLAKPKLLVMIRLILDFLAKELAVGGMISCAQDDVELGEVFRLDAKAEGETVAIGG